MPLNDIDLSTLKPDALVPAAVEAKAENVAEGKAALKPAKCFVLAILAGMYIGMGALFFGLVLGDGTVSFLATRLLGGLCFCLGLSLVVTCGAELFTGNALMICAASSKKISWKSVFVNWLIVWCGNLVGSLLMVVLAYFSEVGAMNGGAVGEALVNLAAYKMALAPGTILAKGILCNALVCLAVYISFAGRTIVDKIVGLILPITAFVACGFEHCIANMFFLPFGMLLHASGVGGPLEVMTLCNMAINIGIATVGNIIGGAILVGLPYWFAYGSRR